MPELKEILIIWAAENDFLDLVNLSTGEVSLKDYVQKNMDEAKKALAYWEKEKSDTANANHGFTYDNQMSLINGQIAKVKRVILFSEKILPSVVPKTTEAKQ